MTMPASSHHHSVSYKRSTFAKEEKRNEIERQNALLFTRMMKIMKRKDPYNQPERTQGPRVNKKLLQ